MDNQTRTNRVPPNNLDAERSVLGACMLEQQAFFKVSQIITGDDFYKSAHKIIFEAMIALDSNREPIDEVTLSDQIEKQGQLANIGGRAYIASLVDNIPTAANAEAYALIVHNKALARRLIDASTEIVTTAMDDTQSPEDLLGLAEQSIFQISKEQHNESFHSIRDVVKANFSTIQKLFEKKEPISGVPTGYTRMDKVTTGFHPGNLIILAARPGMGKTAFALNVAQNMALQYNIGVAIFSLEMSAEELSMRLLSSQARLSMQSIKQGKISQQDLADLIAAAGELSNSPIFINDEGGMDLFKMRSLCRRLKMEHENIKMIIIDYLQLMSGRGRKDGSREQEIAEISRGLKSMAKELGLPVMALSQLSRSVENRTNKEPQLSDLRESGAIEQDADMVIFIHRPDYYDKDDEKLNGQANIIIGKHRNGPTDKIPLAFIPEYVRFENLEEHHSDGY